MNENNEREGDDKPHNRVCPECGSATVTETSYFVDDGIEIEEFWDVCPICGWLSFNYYWQ